MLVDDYVVNALCIQQTGAKPMEFLVLGLHNNCYVWNKAMSVAEA